MDVLISVFQVAAVVLLAVGFFFIEDLGLQLTLAGVYLGAATLWAESLRLGRTSADDRVEGDE